MSRSDTGAVESMERIEAVLRAVAIAAEMPSYAAEARRALRSVMRADGTPWMPPYFYGDAPAFLCDVAPTVTGGGESTGASASAGPIGWRATTADAELRCAQTKRTLACYAALCCSAEETRRYYVAHDDACLDRADVISQRPWEVAATEPNRDPVAWMACSPFQYLCWGKDEWASLAVPLLETGSRAARRERVRLALQKSALFVQEQKLTSLLSIAETAGERLADWVHPVVTGETREDVRLRLAALGWLCNAQAWRVPAVMDFLATTRDAARGHGSSGEWGGMMAATILEDADAPFLEYLHALWDADADSAHSADSAEPRGGNAAAAAAEDWWRFLIDDMEVVRAARNPEATRLLKLAVDKMQSRRQRFVAPLSTQRNVDGREDAEDA
jgi:hypothetical protein